jgi:hypothetical protein
LGVFGDKLSDTFRLPAFQISQVHAEALNVREGVGVKDFTAPAPKTGSRGRPR